MSGGSSNSSTNGSPIDLAASVTAAYFSSLGRAPTSQELSGGVQSLSAGDSIDTLKARLAQSAEAQHVSALRALYQGLFGRSEDAGGLVGWAGVTAGGMSLTNAADALISSAEYTARNGNLSNGDFVGQLYGGFLGRTAATTESAAWISLLDSGKATRGQLAVDFAGSPEAQALASALTQKVAADAGRDYAQASIAAQVAQAVLASPPKTTDLAADIALLNTGANAVALSKNLSQTPDGLIVGQLRGIYEGLLGRSADTAGLQAWLAAVKGGLSLNEAANRFAASAEFSGSHQNLSNADFVQSVYQGFLGHGADDAGKAAWLAALNAGTASRGDLIAGVLRSSEAQAPSSVLSQKVALDTVAAVRLPPAVTVTLAGQTVSAGTAWSFSLPAGLFSESAAGDVLSYSSTGSALPAWLSFDPTQQVFSGMPTDALTGPMDVVVTATDQVGLSSSATLHLSVVPVFARPAVSVTGLAQAVSAGASFGFTLPAGLFSEDSLTYAATFNGSALPGWLSFDATRQVFSGVPTDGMTGEVDVLVTATDLGGLASSATLALSVLPAFNAPTPAGALTAQTVSAGTAFTYSLPMFSEADAGDMLTYTASLANGSALPGWLSFDATRQVFSGVPTDGMTGEVDVLVTATDLGGLSSSTTLPLSVMPVFNAPTLTGSLTAQTVSAGTAFTYSLPGGLFSEADAGDTLQYKVSLAGVTGTPNWLTIDSAGTTLSGTPTDAATGALTVVVTATDP